jgi:DNA-binding NarL/FixJ family response regulator
VSQPSTNPNSERPPLARALLVESDLFFSARILSALDRMGVETRTAASREAAEAGLSECRPDLVIVNLASPALGGIETIRRVKAVSPSTRVIAFLSHTKIPDVRAEVLAAGADKLCANSAISLRLPDIVRDTLAGRSRREEE